MKVVEMTAILVCVMIIFYGPVNHIQHVLIISHVVQDHFLLKLLRLNSAVTAAESLKQCPK